MINKKLISSLTPLRPINVTNLSTGEVSNIDELDEQLLNLLEYVRNNVKNYYSNPANKEKLHNDILTSPPMFSPAEWARQRGYLLDDLPEPEVKARSRIQKLYQHKLITEVSSYVLNSNLRKQVPSFGLKINLGAVDSQMATLSVIDDVLTLRLKAWHYDYLIDFNIPHYINNRNILKWSLPTIEVVKGYPVFVFSIQEKSRNRGSQFSQIAGLDLGRNEPYTMSITNLKGSRIAHYTTSGRLRQLNNKRERLLTEKSQILKKSDHYAKLGIDNTILKLEATRTGGKASKLAQVIAQQISAEITRKLTKHNLNTLAVENLSWVHGAKYGSKWNHSQIQQKLEHSLAREGIQMKKVNPKNTSQTCHKCGARITHNTKKRTIHCNDCKIVLDRDINPSLNITKKLIKPSAPAPKSKNGNNYSHQRQIIEEKTSRSVHKKPRTAT